MGQTIAYFKEAGWKTASILKRRGGEKATEGCIMLRGWIRFYLHLFTHFFVAGHHRAELIIDDSHPHYRRFSARYKKKQSMVKNCWIVAGLITLAFPLLHVAMVIMLTTTFLSFCLLDETQ